MRRLLVMLLSLALLYQGMAFAYSGMAFCAGDPSPMAMAPDVHELADPCCAGQPGDTGSGVSTTDCGSALGCSVPVAVLPDRPLVAQRLVADSPVTQEPSFHSLDIRDVWRPPVIV